ncbi:MAG TPA: alpha-amylase family protein [Acidimicrobiia bacterium]|nr:alpha-amylase family protein [Acidimicrobiia bacterium]
MSHAQTSDLWWKNSVIYCLDVATYLDWDGDGCGDLQGMTERLDYLAGIGVNCVWLMPFFPSPNRDDGYDIIDYYGVDERLGHLGDFVAFVRTAKDRGLRVIIDLVINHTSDQHPWFQASRSDPESPYRDFYVWRDEPGDKPKDQPVFPDTEDSIWSRDREAGQWYLHHFYSHQPDLNIGNPAVRDEIAKVAGFWLELGVDGFRVDAVPFLLETGGIPGDVDLNPHDMLRDLRAFIARRRGSAMMVGEVNLPPKPLRQYFGDEDGDELHMQFAFPVMQAMYLALARQDATPLASVLRELPPIPDDSQWAHFARNHDELTLDQLSPEERQEVFDAFGPDEDMQLYGRGLRRRLPTMLGGDQRRLRLVYSLVFTLPGTPVLFYGEEIGMGENLDIEGRLSVRTPMQWNSGHNGGFSTAHPADLQRPLVEGGFAPENVNVYDQRRDPDSLLNWMERAIRRRREVPEFGWGDCTILDTGDDAVLAHRCDWEGSTVLAVHNLSDSGRSVWIDLGKRPLPEGPGELEDLLTNRPGVEIDDRAIQLDLDGYGHRWFRVRPGGHPSAP